MGIVPTDEEGKLGPVLQSGVDTSLLGSVSMLHEEGTFASLWHNLLDLFFPVKLPPLVLESKPIPVVDRMVTKQNPKATALAVVVYIILALFLWLMVKQTMHQIALKKQMDLTNVVVPPPMPVAKDQMHGGGGQHDNAPVSQGKMPKFAEQQITPPKAPPMEQPKIRMPDATIEVQPNLKMANSNLPNFGMTNSPLVGNSMGNGRGGGIGSGSGNGLGPGSGGNYGGGVKQIGGGVSQPVAIYQPEPEFSEEARKAKFQGVVTVSIIVDDHGKPQNVHVSRGVGMGLDQKAVEAVQQYRFKPARENGKPVAVYLNVEVNFEIF
jgi:protein TonB